MNVTDYTYLMNKPDTITEKQADALSSVLNEFPYFQSARALRLKGLYNQNSFKYNYALKVTAAHTADRSVLFDFITSEAFTSIQNDFFEQKLRDLLEIKVFDSEIISTEQIQKAIAVKVDPVEQSILNSIKEATPKTFEESVKTSETVSETILKTPETQAVSFEEPVKAAEPIHIPVVNETAATVRETAAVNQEESIKTEEFKNLPEIDPSILLAIKQAQSVTYEKTVKAEEPKELPVIDFTNLKEAYSVTYEKPASEKESAVEEQPKTNAIEHSILNSIKTAENTVAAEKTEEPKIDPAIERSILSSIKEATPAIEEPIQKEAPKAESFTQETVSNTIEEEDDSVIEEMIIPEFRIINPIERSILSSIKEAETPKATEIPAAVEVPNEIDTEVQEDVIEIQEQTEEFVEPKIERTEESNQSLVAEDHLEIGKPLDFSFNEKHSFQEWLKLSKTEPIDRSKDDLEKSESIKNDNDTKNAAPLPVDERQKKAEIIDKFIENNPKISPIKSGNINPTVQIESSNDDNSYLMTETLARVYLEQKKYTKAIQAYEILILKYPEKITFFADRISDIKILQQNNNNNN